ncbi:MAG: C10 family peptidase [Bacteroidota bacterium]
MKKYLFLLLCVFQFQFLSAQSINNAQALKAASQFLLVQDQGVNYSIASEQLILSEDGVPLSYLFSLSPLGYIAVSGDRDFHPIVAYSFSGNNSGPDNDNPLIYLIKKDYSNRLQNKNKIPTSIIQKNQLAWESLCNTSPSATKDSAFQQWPAAGSTPTGGWVLTKWTQSSPYNSMCPMDLVAGSRSYTGCPATAMAQIINFHQTLNGTRFSDADDYYHNYGSNQFQIDDDYAAYGFPSFPQLNLYLDTLENKYLSKASLTNNDKAALSFACGLATKTVYNSAGSGTFGVDQAYNGFLRMGFTTCQLLDTSVADPLPQVIANIKDTLPALLAVVDAAWSTGHNLVIDGYNTDDFFHLNFGWGGSYDGWYNIPSGMPYNLTVFEGIIVDIEPQYASGMKDAETNPATLSLFPNPAKEMLQISFLADDAGKYSIVIFDALGRAVSEQMIQANAGSQLLTKIPLTNISTGMYSVKVTGTFESFSAKFIKL